MAELEGEALSNPYRFRDELFDLLAIDGVREVLRLSSSRPLTVREINDGVGNPLSHASSEGITREQRDRLCRLGLLQGNRASGYRLAAGEVLDLMRHVHSSDLGAGWWALLARPTVRSIMASVIDGGCLSRDLSASCGPAPRVSESLKLLSYAGQVVLQKVPEGSLVLASDDGLVAKVLVESELLLYGLLLPAATNSFEALERLRNSKRDLSQYEPGPHEPRPTPNRALSAHRALPADVVRDIRIFAALAVLPRLDVGRSLPPVRRAGRQRHPATGMQTFPRGQSYAAESVGGRYVIESLLQEVINEPPAPTVSDGPPPSPSQVRGRQRAEALRRDRQVPLADLQPPTIEWRLAAKDDPTSTWAAARFDPVTNQLWVNSQFTGLKSLDAEYAAGRPDDDTPWWLRHVHARHAFRLVETILLHEHAAGRRENATDPPLTTESLTAAAHWRIAERRDLRRELHQYFRLADGPAPASQKASTVND